MANPEMPFDFAKIMGELEPKKMMDQFTKALNAYQLPGVDAQSLLESSRKNVEALAAANKQAVEGYQAVMTRQGEILRDTVEEATANLKKLATGGNPAEAASKQAELLREAVERALANMRELAELVQKSNTEAFEIVKKRVEESLSEIKGLTQKLKK